MDIAEKARCYYDRLDWKDSRGTKVKSWKQKIAAVWFTDEKIKEHSKQTPSGLTGEAATFV